MLAHLRKQVVGEEGVPKGGEDNYDIGSGTSIQCISLFFQMLLKFLPRTLFQLCYPSFIRMYNEDSWTRTTVSTYFPGAYRRAKSGRHLSFPFITVSLLH